MDNVEAYRAAGEIFGYLKRDNIGELYMRGCANSEAIVFGKISNEQNHTLEIKCSYAISLSELSLLRDKIYREEMAKSITDKWDRNLRKALSST